MKESFAHPSAVAHDAINLVLALRMHAVIDTGR